MVGVMNAQAISRRAALRGMGVAMGLPLLESVVPSGAKAAASEGGKTERPVRMAVLYVPNGMHPHQWTPEGQGADFTLSPVLEPLAKMKSDLLVLTELWNAASDTGDGHYVKTGGFLTGTTITKTTGSDIRSGGVSVDQMAARKIGNLTPLPSLELGIEPVTTGVDVNVGYTRLYGSHIAWATPTTPLAKEINPKLAFDRLFRSNLGARKGSAEEDRSVLDLVLSDAKRMRARIGSSDQRKLDEFLDSVRSVEKRIEFDARRQSREVMEDGEARRAVEAMGRRVDPYSDPARVSERAGDHTEHVRLMLDIMILAFWTDSTRISTFMFGNAVSGRNFAFLPGVSGAHHPISHHENDAKKMEEYKRINQWHVSQYAYMLERMKSIQDGEGTLLDQSMVLFGAGMRDGNRHDPKNLPIVLAGRGGGTLKTGRHLVFEKRTPLTNLYRSMLSCMGTPVSEFADSTGELAGLKA